MARPLGGYPSSFGNKVASVFPVTGPGSYTQYTAPTTGGQDVDTAPTSGVKMVNFALGAVTTDGLYRAEVVQIEVLKNANGVVIGSRLILRWYVVATGAQVAGAFDLSGSTANIFVLGDN